MFYLEGRTKVFIQQHARDCYIRFVSTCIQCQSELVYGQNYSKRLNTQGKGRCVTCHRRHERKEYDKARMRGGLVKGKTAKVKRGRLLADDLMDLKIPLHPRITPEIAAILDQDYEVSTVKVSVAYASGSEDGWGLSDSHPHH